MICSYHPIVTVYGKNYKLVMERQSFYGNSYDFLLKSADEFVLVVGYRDDMDFIDCKIINKKLCPNFKELWHRAKFAFTFGRYLNSQCAISF